MEVLGILRVAMWLVAVFAVCAAVIIGLILGYHWRKYSGNPRAAKFSMYVYSAVSLVILLCLVGSIPA